MMTTVIQTMNRPVPRKRAIRSESRPKASGSYSRQQPAPRRARLVEPDAVTRPWRSLPARRPALARSPAPRSAVHARAPRVRTRAGPGRLLEARVSRQSSGSRWSSTSSTVTAPSSEPLSSTTGAATMLYVAR